MRITKLHEAVRKWPVKIVLPDDPLTLAGEPEALKEILRVSKYASRRVADIIIKYHEQKTIFVDGFLRAGVSFKSASNPVVQVYMNAMEDLSKICDGDAPDRQRKAAERESKYLHKRLGRINDELSTLTETEARTRPMKEMIGRQLYHVFEDIKGHLNGTRVASTKLITDAMIHELIAPIFNHVYHTEYFNAETIKGLIDDTFQRGKTS
jgi:hypothetical protein